MGKNRADVVALATSMEIISRISFPRPTFEIDAPCLLRRICENVMTPIVLLYQNVVLYDICLGSALFLSDRSREKVVRCDYDTTCMCVSLRRRENMRQKA